MTNEPETAGLEWAPDACILPIGERPLRQAEFDELFSSAVQAAERVGPTHLRLALSGTADLETVVRDLTDRETQCCSFFTFTIASPSSGRVNLDIQVPDAHIGVLNALASRADRARRPR
jgi:hypothetical protein